MAPHEARDQQRQELLADLVVAHVEVPHTLRGREHTFDVPAPPSDPDHLQAWNAKAMLYRIMGNKKMAELCKETARTIVASR